MMWEVRLGPEVEAWFLDLCQTDATTADRVAEAIDGIMLDCGQRDDVTRWVHPDLLRQDSSGLAAAAPCLYLADHRPVGAAVTRPGLRRQGYCVLV
jgi:hypothetical protein